MVTPPNKIYRYKNEDVHLSGFIFDIFMRDNTYNSEYMPVYFICLSEIGRKHTQPLQQVYHILYKKTITKFFLCKYIFHKNKKYAAEKPRTEKRIICYCCHTTFSNPNENEKRGCIFSDFNTKHSD